MNASQLPTLPALRCLGRLAEVRPDIIVDTREQAPLIFTRLSSRTGTLITGDYSFAGAEERFAVERKSIADLVACCVGDNRDRFFRELHRLRGFLFKRLLIVGTAEEVERGTYRSQVKPAAVLATLSALEVRFDVPVVFASLREEAACKIESWVYWFAREQVEILNGVARSSGLTASTRYQPPVTPGPPKPQA
ncbi:MAG TPA: ERCC4 domain-containing protein [Opitutaceae bacterium]|jgi:DNA excision repair protein ERCC-4|nr:ERCC4 domain-containing protein [Opitutaceae bacterium]